MCPLSPELSDFTLLDARFRGPAAWAASAELGHPQIQDSPSEDGEHSSGGGQLRQEAVANDCSGTCEVSVHPESKARTEPDGASVSHT